VYSRDYQSANEKFNLSKSTPVLFRPQIVWNAQSRSFELGSQSALEFVRMTPSENQLVKDLISDLFPQEVFNLNAITQSWGEGHWSVKELQFLKDELGLSIVVLPTLFENLDSLMSRAGRGLGKSEKLTAPQSIMNDRNPLVVADRFVTLNWDSPGGAPFFSWRMRNLPDGGWSSWSDFSRLKSVSVSRGKAGRYQFELKAMNLVFEIQQTPTLFEFSISEPEVQQAPSSETPDSEWTSPAVARDEARRVPEIKQVKPVADGGLFGCSLKVREEPKSRWAQNLILSLLGLVLSIVLWRVRRRLADTAGSSGFSSLEGAGYSNF